MRGVRQKNKPAEAGLLEVYDIALSLVHERGLLLKLLRANAVRKKRDNVFNATFKRLKRLEGISHQVQLALRHLGGVEDGAGRVEAVGKQELRALVFYGPPAVRKKSSRAVVNRNSEPAAHDASRGVSGTVGERRFL